MAINFPDSPSVDEIYSVGDKSWLWNGTYWEVQGAPSSTFSASDTAPLNVADGHIWYRSDQSQTLIRYDGTWVEVGSAGGFDSSSTSFPSSLDSGTGFAAVEALQAKVGADSSGVATSHDYKIADHASRLTTLEARAGTNLLYNGAMQVAQRGTSSAGITTGGYYTADRWQITKTSLGTWTQSVENDAPTGSGFSKSLKMLCTTADASPAANDFLSFRQTLEGQDLQHIRKGTSAAKQLTVSFWVKSNVTGTYTLELIDADNTRYVSASYSIDASATWEKKTITFPADTTGVLDNDNQGSLRLSFWLGVGTGFSSGTLSTSWTPLSNPDRAVGQTNLASAVNNYWQITGVQLEVGDKATTFEHRSYGEELALCQRYYYKLVSGGAYTWFTSGWSAGTTLVNSFIQLPVSMRTTPTTLDATGSFEWQSTSNATYSASSLNILATESSSTVVLIRMTTASQTAGLWGHLRGVNSSDAAIGLGAEL